jgi:GNAT superfamily N-acetyltransferase
VGRTTTSDDDPALAELLKAAYRGTIDDDPDQDYVAELRDWRTVDHADDAASRVAVIEGELVSCCLIGYDLGAAFVYEVASAPTHARQGIASALVAGSICTLADREVEALWAWVTVGNHASEALLGMLGFLPVTPPLTAAGSRLLYRAAAALGSVDASTAVAVGVRIVDGPELVLFGRGTDQVIESHGASIRVRVVAPDDPEARPIAASCMPVRNEPFFIDARS